MTAGTPLLSVRNLSVSFGSKATEFQAVKEISFDLFPQETLAVVGESGSGKSVTALSLLKLLPYPLAHHPSGSVFFEGKDILTLDEKTLNTLRGQKISMIFQEPMTSLNPLHTVEKQIGEVLLLHKGLSQEKTRARILELLSLVGFRDGEDRLKRYPHELSGGQRQRIMIAMALACEPNILIADEPTTALDVTTQAQILVLLKDLQKKMKMSLLLITHDLSIVKKMADRVIVMEQGKIVEQNKAKTLFEGPQHPYTKQLLASEPKGLAEPISKDAPLLLTAEKLDVRFPIKSGFLQRIRGYVHAVFEADFEVKKGETLGIVGESGSGKTTLALALLELIPSTGLVTFETHVLHALKKSHLRPLRRELQIVFQDPFSSLSPRMTISGIIGEGLEVHQKNLSHEKREALIIDVLKDVGLDPKTRHRYPHEFSGGQRQRISIARALILKPKLMILDEPTSALDRAVQVEILELLKRLQKEHHLTYLFISHDLKVVRSISHRVIVMKDGRIVERGSASDIFDAPREPYTKSLIKAAFDLAS